MSAEFINTILIKGDVIIRNNFDINWHVIFKFSV